MSWATYTGQCDYSLWGDVKVHVTWGT